MMNFNSNEQEKAAICLLGLMYESGIHSVFRLHLQAMLKLEDDDHEFESLMKILEGWGFIEDVNHAMGDHGMYSDFSISQRAMDYKREVETKAREPRDVVAEFERWKRSTPWIAYPYVIGRGLLAMIGAFMLIAALLSDGLDGKARAPSQATTSHPRSPRKHCIIEGTRSQDELIPEIKAEDSGDLRHGGRNRLVPPV